MLSRTVVDLTHAIAEGMPMFPGLPSPEIREHLTRSASRAHYTGGTTFLIHEYRMIGNSGTYLDTPFHRYADGADCAALPLERTAHLPGIVLDMTAKIAARSLEITPADLAELDGAGCALLVRTGWDAKWGKPDYLAANPYLTDGAAAALVAMDVALVGIDSWNVDDVRDARRPVHSRLLRAGIPIVENLCNLDQLPPRHFRFSAVPLAIRGGSAVSVRAYGICDGG